MLSALNLLFAASSSAVSSDFPIVDTLILVFLIVGTIAGTFFTVAYMKAKAKRMRRERLIAEFLAIPSERFEVTGDTTVERLISIRTLVKAKFFPAQA